MKKYLIIIVLFIFPSIGFGADYYVDVDATDDTGIGTQGDPWKYIPGQSSSTHAGDVSAGDIIYCQRGDTWNEQVDVLNGITYDAYGAGDNPTLDLESVNNAKGFYGTSIATCTVKNFTVLGSGAGQSVRFEGTSGDSGYGIRFENCQIENDSLAGDSDEFDCVSTDGSAQVWLEECTLTNCREGSGSQAITAHGTGKIYVNGGSISNSGIAAMPGAGATETTLYDVDISGISSSMFQIGDATATFLVDSCNITGDGAGAFVYQANSSIGTSLTIQNSTINITVSDSGNLRGLNLSFLNNTVTVNSSDFRQVTALQAGSVYSRGNTYNITDVDTAFWYMNINGDTFRSIGDILNAPADVFVRDDEADAIISHLLVNGGTSTVVIVTGGNYGPDLFANWTVYNNSAGALIDNNLSSGDTGSLTVTNSIFHTVTDPIDGTNDLTVSYNNYYNSPDEGGTGSITTEPPFINVGTDFRLSAPLNGVDPFSDGDGDQYDVLGVKVWDDTTDSPTGPWANNVDLGSYGYQTSTPAAILLGFF